MAKKTINKDKKHQDFVKEYLNNGMNAKQAYMSVYKYSTDKVAEVLASRLLRNDNVKALLEVEFAKTAEKFELTKENMINELKKLIASCVQEGNDGNGTIKDRTNWNKAIDTLNKMGGLYDPIKVSVDTSINIKFDLSEDDEEGRDNN